jgi:HSP20 family molecular chaperone IbpA
MIFDLPLVEKKEDLVLSATEDSLRLEARLRNSVSLMVGGSYQRNVKFEKYTKRIQLPTKVGPEKARARLQNEMLPVEFPRSKSGRKVTIE